MTRHEPHSHGQFQHRHDDGGVPHSHTHPDEILPDDYAAIHGPTVGDRVRLGDTGLVIRVEYDAQDRGNEFLAGFGKTARDGLLLKAAAVRETCDLVISNVVIIDATRRIGKASIGIREGRIHAIGRAGNPDFQDDVDVVVGTGTSIISGEGLIATAGAIDTHVHLLSPRIMEASLAAGVTTIIGQEFGPVWGVGVNSPWALRHAFNAFDAWPVNIGFLARGSSSDEGPLVEALVEGGAAGFKVHEDLGAHTRALDTALDVAERYDVQVALHTDGLNECLSVDDTLSVLDGRTIHAFHIEGCGGGHVPNVLRLAGVPNVLIVGADRIAANGDTANKIGTYGLAVLAAAHGVPFFVAAPSSSFDLTLVDGAGIPIEERSPAEVTAPWGQPLAPAGAAAYNPAFDVTPARLIRGIVTEHGVVSPVDAAGIARMLGRG